MLKTKQHLSAVYFFLCGSTLCIISDVITKYVGVTLEELHVTGLRFLFCLIFATCMKKHITKPVNIWVEVTRGILFFLAQALWIYGLNKVQIIIATIIGFLTPSITLILSVFLTKEKISWQRWTATIVGFTSICICCNKTTEHHIPKYVSALLLSTFIFTVIDVINKKYAASQSPINTIFYCSLFSTIVSIPSTIYYWKTPTITELLLVATIGIISNITFLCLLKAFQREDITALVPYKYLEIVIAAVLGYIIFQEVPSKTTLVTSAIIVTASIWLSKQENKYTRH
ncbi:DMT family transporter [Candidatus Sneabacter namystus]|uniref:S-adenosylmethionine uptake transporter n=1 Tax=Candidatus Sneabacter namystus TaxID=2601646 RepID=A0A5C0UGT1_9RICK|nr:DMT family transporter [Candidatus Sneabacter namystus]QEK39335.1 DMT family transporter [Candidatus Sneabacter namystus]